MKRQKLIYRCEVAFGLALFLKIFSGGIAYYATLDDYVQYGSYPLFDLEYVYFHIGTISSRPLASLLDPVFWGDFWDPMWPALLMITALYFLACVLLDRILTAEGIQITPLLYTVCLLLPLTFEGTYWISASSRIVVGLFFAAAAARTLQRYLKDGEKPLIYFYAVFCLLSFGFYESVLVFSGLLQLFVLIKHAVEKKTYKNLWLAAIPAAFAVSFLVYYKLAAGIGALGSRASEFSAGNPGARLLELLSQLGYILTAGVFRTTVNGFADGLQHLVTSPLWGLVILICILAVSAGCARCCKGRRLHASVKVCLPLGLALTLLPLLPNMLVPDVWLTYRSVAVCIPGLCVLLAPLAARLLQDRSVRAAAVGVAVFVFSVGCVNELQTYKNVHALDNALVSEVVAHLDEEVLAGEKSTILVLPHEIAASWTSYYKDHVKSVFYADWALTGAVRAKTRNNRILYITPVYSLDGVDTEGKLILYMDPSYHVTEEQYE